MSEQVLQSGSLGEPAFLDLLMAARRAPFPVVLHVARADHERSIWLAEGRIVGFETTAAAEGLAAMLVKRNKLQPETAQDVNRSAAAEGSSVGAIIQRLRLLPAAALSREASLWATLLIVQTFAWETGTFRLVSQGRSDQPPLPPLDVNLPTAMKSGVFKRVTPARARADLALHSASCPLLLADPAIDLTDFGLSDAEVAFATSLDGRRSSDEVLATAPDKNAAAQLLYLLSHAQSVEHRVPDALDAAGDDLGDLLEDFGADDFGSGDGFGAVAADSRPPEVPLPGGIDFSQITFGSSSGGGRSRTTHTSTANAREEVASAHERARVQVVTGSTEAISDDSFDSLPDRPPGSMSGLGNLFDDVGDSGRRVAPPRGGSAGWKPEASKPPSKPASPAGAGGASQPTGPGIDRPPTGAAFTVETAEWNRLTSKEKARCRELAARLLEMEGQNYFQWLDLPNEATLMSVKKAFFKLAQRFHPDKMLDESEVYARIAEVLFTKVSEAYETLGDEESSSAYVKKHIHGEKDENDLAMEQVQKILVAEGDFKRGQRMLNAGKLVGALSAFEDAMKGYPEEGEYVAHYGYVLFRVKQKSDPADASAGLDLIKKGMEMSPIATMPPHLLGKAYIAMGDGEEAKKALRVTLKMNADNPEALRDYKRADAMSKGEDPDGRPDAAKKSGLKGLFGRLKKGS